MGGGRDRARTGQPGPGGGLRPGCGVRAGLRAADRARHELATDRSGVAVRRTAERNASHVTDGRLEVRCSSLAGLVVPDDGFDVAFTVNVNLFWTRDPGPELEVLRRALAPGGTLFVLYGGDAPTGERRTLDVVRSRLGEHGWSTRDLRGAHGLGVAAGPR